MIDIELCNSFVLAVNLIRSGRHHIVKNGVCHSEDRYWRVNWRVNCGKNWVAFYGNAGKKEWILALYDPKGTLYIQSDGDGPGKGGKKSGMRSLLLNTMAAHLADRDKIPTIKQKKIEFDRENPEKAVKLPVIELNQQNIYKIFDLGRLFALHCIEEGFSGGVAGSPDEERIPLEKEFYDRREKFIAEHWDGWSHPHPEDWYSKTFTEK